MKAITVLGTIALIMFVGAAATATAQETKSTDKSTQTLTGCLQRAGNGYEFSPQDGGTLKVNRNSVNLAPHIGQTLTITGVVTHPMHQTQEDNHGPDRSTEQGYITITHLQVVRESCQVDQTLQY
jgi:hypothetical protein